MTIDLKHAEALMERMQALGIAELEVGRGTDRYRIVRQTATVTPLTVQARSEPGSAAASIHTPAKATATQTVTSSMHGVFYRAAGPDQPPFVEEGTSVHEGQTLYILEVMKTLSRIGSEFAGKIAAILVEDGQSVEPGTPLFTVESTDA